MDSRTAAHAFASIAALLELQGENRFKSRAYEQAARRLQAIDADDLAPLLRSGELEGEAGFGPATLGVLRDLVTTGESRYLEQLQRETPEGLVEMLRIPGLGTAKIHQIHTGLGITGVDELEAAARDGRLASLPRFGDKTAEKVLRGIEFLRRTGEYSLYHRAAAEGARLLAAVSAHPDVERAALAGALRRHAEVVRDVDVVAACHGSPAQVAASFTRLPGVREATGAGQASVTVRFVDGATLHLHCVRPAHFAVALWRATGSAEHLRDAEARAARLGFTVRGDELLDAHGAAMPVRDEEALYRLLGLAFVAPELREGRGEVEAAARHQLPRLVELADIRGALHCHSDYSDGKATVREMADAALERGWSYLGITDHSESASYAGGLTPDRVRRQHDEIDRVNDELAGRLRVLKGIEADILADGRLDYDARVLDRFDFVIGSVHSRFTMAEREMTDRVLAALDDPHLTILGHPTGRLLLSREPYAVDMHAVLARAGEVGVAVEINADPHRLDLDWRLCAEALERGVTLEIGPDAHSTNGLDNVAYGVGIARKGWVSAEDVLNARSADDVLAFARRRARGSR